MVLRVGLAVKVLHHFALPLLIRLHVLVDGGLRLRTEQAPFLTLWTSARITRFIIQAKALALGWHISAKRL